jgi:NAD(P)-dependent dehydrogenase (short-subunit alcohol dehydrogenase family)
MDLQLRGKVGIVTGASRGIGRAIAKTLSDEGMRLTLVARSRDQLEELSASLAQESLIQSADLREPGVSTIAVAETIERFGRLDLLVNNAGATKRGDFLSLNDDDWIDGFALKFYGAMRLSRAAWPYLQACGGSIVNVVGVGGRTGSADFTIGGAVNSALLNLTKALADKGVTCGVRVNAINPGSIVTERLKLRLRTLADEQGIDEAEAARAMTQASRVARFGEPVEIARAVAFLASPQADYIQGALLDIDGGQTRTL